MPDLFKWRVFRPSFKRCVLLELVLGRQNQFAARFVAARPSTITSTIDTVGMAFFFGTVSRVSRRAVSVIIRCGRPLTTLTA